MSELAQLTFAGTDIHTQIEEFDNSEIDRLDFGVIGFDDETVVRRYNTFESECAGLTSSRVVGQPLFTVVAPCMNNYLVAQRFEDAALNRVILDETIDYVLTLRMRPTKVNLRLLASPSQGLRYVLVSRRDK
jgi:photoactive yellow protein